MKLKIFIIPVYVKKVLFLGECNSTVRVGMLCGHSRSFIHSVTLIPTQKQDLWL